MLPMNTKPILSFVFAVVLCLSSLVFTHTLSAQIGAQPRYSMMTGELEGAKILEQNLSFRQWKQRPTSALTQDELEAFSGIQQKTEFLVFLGTWCPDSQRNVPPLMNALEEANNANLVVRYIGVDRRKVDPDTLVDTYDIYRVPTIIVFQDGQELGRMIERPDDSVIQDLLKLIAKKD